MPTIHASAIVDPRAEIADDVEVGPFCLVGPDVRIGAGSRLHSHVVLAGRIFLGRRNVLFPGVVLGSEPTSANGDSDTLVVVGDDNVFREMVTVYRASMADPGHTLIGSNCHFMARCHVGEDCHLGNQITLGTGTRLGRFVRAYDRAVLEDNVSVASNVAIGEQSRVRGLSRVEANVPPYTVCDGRPARPRMLNGDAFKGSPHRADDFDALTEAFQLVFRAGTTLDDAREILRRKNFLRPCVNHLLTFLENEQEIRRHPRQFRRAA